MITLNVSYRLQGSSTWNAINTFQRPITYSEKIDETLDFGQLDFQAVQPLNLPPFTQIRLTASDDAGGSLPLYSLVGTPTAKMVRST